MMGALGEAVSWWAVYYSDHQMVSLTVQYLHLAAILIGGGAAIAADREIFASARGNDRDCRAAAVAVVQHAHGVVVPALGVMLVSGVLMTMADWTTFVASPLFWIKMGLVGLLVANGAGLMAAGRRHDAGQPAHIWRRIVAASGVSFLLWLLILWMGAWLTVAA
jgi:hypothetical protein